MFINFVFEQNFCGDIFLSDRVRILSTIRSHRTRRCKHAVNTDMRLRGLLWVIFHDDVQNKDFHRCEECMKELVGFIPLEARVLRKDRECCRCHEVKKVIGFKTPIPVPGQRAFVCIDCFKEVGAAEEGGVVPDVQRW